MGLDLLIASLRVLLILPFSLTVSKEFTLSMAAKLLSPLGCSLELVGDLLPMYTHVYLSLPVENTLFESYLEMTTYCTFGLRYQSLWVTLTATILVEELCTVVRTECYTRSSTTPVITS